MHVSETLGVAIRSLNAMAQHCRELRASFNLALSTGKCDRWDGVSSRLASQLQFLENLLQRSSANNARIQNKIALLRQYPQHKHALHRRTAIGLQRSIPERQQDPSAYKRRSKKRGFSDDGYSDCYDDVLASHLRLRKLFTRRTTAHKNSAEVLTLPRRPCLEQTSSLSNPAAVHMALFLLYLASFGSIGPSQFLRLWQPLLCGSGRAGG